MQPFPFVLREIPRHGGEILRRDGLAGSVPFLHGRNRQGEGPFVGQAVFLLHQESNALANLVQGRLDRQLRHVGGNLLTRLDTQDLFPLVHALRQFHLVFAL